VEPTNYPQPVNGLRAARERRELSQEQLAQIIGVTDGSISNWEIGRNPPQAPTRKLLALVFGESEQTIESWFESPQAIAS
jgi:transcriptional regulator with XRE-family HTH domain